MDKTIDMPVSSPSTTPIVAVVGATASGKTGLSLEIGEALTPGGGEIVNTDAMALYRGMDIGTAKPDAAQRARLPHHLIDVLDVREPATVAAFQQWARTVIAGIRARGRSPVLVGGSALYTRAVLDRFDFPGTDVAIRLGLESEVDRLGVPALHARLAQVDPESAGRIGPDNARRIVRALEVFELTGRPFSASLPQLEYVEPATVQIGVDLDRPTLHARIEARVRAMFESGFVAEVEGLLTNGLEGGRTASRAIGYGEVAAHLRGERSLDQAIEQTVIATRRFARRQDSWFRKDPRVVWVPYDAPDRLALAMAAVERLKENQ